VELEFMFFFNSILLGFGLAMDAFSVSLANGLNEHGMKLRKMCLVAGVFALFQALMPFLGWLCVNTIVSCFEAFETFIPWIALILLSFIGVGMLRDGLKRKDLDTESPGVGAAALLVQGLATSIDALSVGFTIADYAPFEAVLASAIIGAVTFCICLSGIEIGKHMGTKLSGKAGVLGGIILIFIGIEIFVSRMF